MNAVLFKTNSTFFWVIFLAHIFHRCLFAVFAVRNIIYDYDFTTTNSQTILIHYPPHPLSAKRCLCIFPERNGINFSILSSLPLYSSMASRASSDRNTRIKLVAVVRHSNFDVDFCEAEWNYFGPESNFIHEFLKRMKTRINFWIHALVYHLESSCQYPGMLHQNFGFCN